MTEPGPAVEIDGTFNARDVGGHRTADGATMRTGLLYRSASLDQVGDAGRADLVRLGVRTVADLRSTVEIERHGTFDPAATGIEWVHFDSQFGPPTMDPERLDAIMSVDDPMAAIYPRMMNAGSEMFRQGLELLAAGDGVPLLVHCTSGKDRTGLFAIFVQLLCGVPVEAALSDYERSGQVAASVHADMDARFPEMSGIGREKLARMAGTDRVWVQAAFDSIGGVAALPDWLSSVGVTSEAQAAIKERFRG